ncbi:MAG: ABC transporter ATP-binding protein [Pseudomonadota bacterium]
MIDSQKCIQISELSFRWPESASALLNIPSLSITQGESIFIQGSSGSGKSTLLNLITGVLLPNKGNITILGSNLNDQNHNDQFRVDHFGIIFQQFNLIPYLNVFENITLPLSFSMRRKTRLEIAHKSLKAEATRLLDSLSLVGDNIQQRNVTELSTGQQQRVAVARALIGSPEIIIADEPTSALDADAKQDFLDLLFQESKHSHSTLIFVSHDQTLSNKFDRILSMSEYK